MIDRPTCPACGTPMAPGCMEGMCPACLLRAAMGDGSQDKLSPLVTGAAGVHGFPSIAERLGARIGRYKLIEQIGEGGFGIVWMAEQEEPVRRRVALKIIKPGMDTREVVNRFEAERQALAMMDHPNIASVFDGGATETGRPFFVMELVKGAPITTYCDANHLNTHERLELFIDVCHAVQHAHQKGVIHRDLKPSNILVTVMDDRPVPKVIDFGVAKATQAQLTQQTLFTGLNQWIGTPDYMSPEQAGLGNLDVDTRSDIYSLGVLLYELLTGRPPFDPEKLRGAAYDSILRLIREDEPPKPSTRLSELSEDELHVVAEKHGAEPARLDRLMRGDLDWIVMKALEKDRCRRYETANGLADDLRRHLDDEPVNAAAPSLGYRLQKLLRRHRIAAAWTISFALLLLVTSIASTILALFAQRQKDRAERAENKTNDNLYAADMGLAKQALDYSRLAQARDLLRAHIPRAGQVDRRGLEWRHLWQRSRGEQLAVIPLPEVGAINDLVFTPDGTLCVAGGGSGNLVVLRFEDFTVVERIQAAEKGGCSTLSISSDGRRVAVSCGGSVSLWNLNPAGKLTFFRRIKVVLPYAVSFSPDGRKLAIGTEADFWVDEMARGGITKLFDVETGEELATLPESGGRAVAFSPNGQWLATGPWCGGGLKLWDAATLKLTKRVETRVPLWVAFAADGQTLLTGGNFASPIYYDLTGSLPPSQLNRPSNEGIGPNFEGNLSADGRWAAISSGNLLALENLHTHAVKVMAGHSAEIRSLAFSQDSQFVVSGDTVGQLMLWSVSRTAVGRARFSEAKIAERRSVPLHPSSPDGQKLALRVINEVKVIDGKKGRVDAVFATASYPLVFADNHTLITIRGLEFLESHNRLLPKWAARDRKPSLEFWDLATSSSRSVELRAAWGKPISAVAASQSGDLVALAWQADSGDNTNGVMWLDADSGAVQSSTSGFKSAISGLAFSLSGRLFAVTMMNGNVQILTMPGAKVAQSMQVRKDVPTCAVFSPDERRLAVGGWGGVRVWSVPEGREVATIVGQISNVSHILFSENGRTLIGYGHDVTKLWHMPTGRELFTMRYGDARNLIPLTGERYANVAYLKDYGADANVWDVSLLPPLEGAEDWLREQPVNLAEARQLVHAIAPRDPKTPARHMALDEAYSAGLDYNWYGGTDGNDLGPLPRGLQVLKSTAFDIRGIVLPGTASKPSRIQVGQTCQRLRFLHNATCRVLKSGMLIGRYVIHYADGQTAEIPLVLGRNIRGWMADPSTPDPTGEAEVAWIGTNAVCQRVNRSIHLLNLTWRNPHPEIPIQTLEFEQIGREIEPFLVAVTTE